MHYSTAPGYVLDVEQYAAAELRRRALSVERHAIEPMAFSCLLYVTASRYTHVVDFETCARTDVSMLTVSPGEARLFGEMAGRKEWLLVFRS